MSDRAFELFDKKLGLLHSAVLPVENPDSSMMKKVRVVSRADYYLVR
jgi:hypothetical protein